MMMNKRKAISAQRGYYIQMNFIQRGIDLNKVTRPVYMKPLAHAIKSILGR